MNGVLHTTEGSAEVALSHFQNTGITAHFIVGPEVIYQNRGLDRTAGTLRASSSGPTNSRACQIEIEGFSKTSLWLPVEAILARVAACVAYIADFHGIPLRAPRSWPDDCSDMPLPWAANNSRRTSGT